jgi:hypothetical protein
MTVKNELRQLVDSLSEEDAVEALDYVRWLLKEEDDELTAEELTEVERAEAEVADGAYVTLGALRQRLRL